MSPDRWQRLYEIFDAAMDLPATDRAAFLDQASGDDPSLRAEVESLLASASTQQDTFPRAVARIAADYVGQAPGPIGKAIGSYEILRPIGSGGMGEVYLARDTRLGRQVALKVLPTEFTADPYRLHRFHQEALTASALNHPNILVVHEMGEVDGRQFIATEFVEGRTLREVLAQGPMPISRILDVAVQAAAAFAAAHQAGIVHRDIKPENIMIRPDGYVKVLDFGLAKPAGEVSPGSQAKTLSGMVVGTVKYMSPEQARGLAADERSDIFAFGVVLYEMAAGLPPFRGETPTDTLVLTVQAAPQPLAAAAPQTPPELHRIVTKALQKRPEHRHPSMALLRDELAALKRNLNLQSASAGASTQVRAPRLSSRRRIVIGVTAGALGAAGLGAIATRVFRSKSPVSLDTIQFRRVPASSNADFGILSPDARYLAYVQVSSGLSSAWVRQLVSGGAEIPLVSAQPVSYYGMAYTPDGNYLYYVVGALTQASNGTLYRVPALGGESQLIVEGVDATAALSPDGKRIVFLRRRATGAQAGLMIANADGSGVRLLAASAAGEPFPAYHWRNNETIQYFSAGREGHAADWDLHEISADGGPARTLLSRLPGPLAFSHMANPDAIFLIGFDPESGLNQIWYLTLPQGRRYRITHDTAEYHALSAGADGQTLLAVQRAIANNLWLADIDVPLRPPRQITSGVGSYGEPSWISADSIVCTVATGGRWDLWSIAIKDGERRQLTFTGDAVPCRPAVSPDGRSVVFPAGRAGEYSLQSLQLDTGALQLLAAGDAVSAAVFSRDGRWLYYLSGTNTARGLWKIPAEGGQPVRLTDAGSAGIDRSPNGEHLVFESLEPPGLAVLDTVANSVTQPLPAPAGLAAIRYMEDDVVAYAIATGPERGIWRTPLSSGPAKRILSLDEDRLWGFDLSPDGRRVIYGAGQMVSNLFLITGFR